MFIGLSELLPQSNIVYYLKPALPVISTAAFDPVFAHVLKNREIETVLISAYWRPKSFHVPQDSDLETELLATVEQLLEAGKRVYLVGDVPFFSFKPDQCKYRRLWGLNNNCSESSRNYRVDRLTYEPAFERVAEEFPEVTLIDLSEIFCDRQTCSMIDGNDILFRDRNHLNINGSKYLAEKIPSSVFAD